MRPLVFWEVDQGLQPVVGPLRGRLQLAGVPHVEVVGQVPQGLHVLFVCHGFFGPRPACEASTASSRPCSRLQTPQSTLVKWARASRCPASSRASSAPTCWQEVVAGKA